jgi:ATP-dependent DNA helicase RecG
LLSLPRALWGIHLPDSQEHLAAARRRLAFEEALYLQLGLLRQKLMWKSSEGREIRAPAYRLDALKRSLPYELTKAQQRSLQEMLEDLGSGDPMNRLLQGDVGSGKTVIAIYCMLVAIENGCQAALMAPTEILAEQHWLIWREPLEALGVRVGLLTGGLRPKEKRRLSTAGAEGELQLIFGTHALIEEGVEFYRLGLAVVDEQHRFGVMQRAALLHKGLNPDFLVMTATPIPRTLALTLYGDLDISTLDEKPPGRKPVLTRLVRAKERARTDDFLKQRLSAGEQAYLVCPIIEPSAKLDLKSAVKTYKEVCQRFDGFRVGLLHGRMGSSDRLKVMEEFRAQKIQLLVTTTVVEVGVDVPRATLMLIEHPERFGLAQLHQLRGRVGRGSEKAYCFLMEPESSPVGYGEIRERLEFFTQNDDGFQLAEKDLEIRGPGELLGIRQHGLPDLKIADLKEDRRLLFLARDDLAQLLKEDPELSAPGHQMVRKALDDKFRGKVELLGVG